MNQPTPRFAQGGHIPGSGSGDKVPVVLEEGYVVTARTATDAELERLEHLGLSVDARRLRDERDGTWTCPGCNRSVPMSKLMGAATIKCACGYEGRHPLRS